MPGPNERSQRPTSSAYPSSAFAGGGYVAQPVGHQGPPRLGEPPVAGVLAADERALDPELAEHPRRDRDVGAVGLARREVEPGLQGGHPRADLLGGHRAVAAEHLQHRCLGLLQPRGPSSASPAFSTSLASRVCERVGDPRRRAAPRRRQQVAREDEEGAPHRELLDQRAVVVQRPVDVGHGDPVDAGPDRQVDGRRLGGVQHGDRPRRGLGIGRAVRRAPARAAAPAGPAARCQGCAA